MRMNQHSKVMGHSISIVVRRSISVIMIDYFDQYDLNLYSMEKMGMLQHFGFVVVR